MKELTVIIHARPNSLSPGKTDYGDDELDCRFHWDSPHSKVSIIDNVPKLLLDLRDIHLEPVAQFMEEIKEKHPEWTPPKLAVKTMSVNGKQCCGHNQELAD